MPNEAEAVIAFWLREIAPEQRFKRDNVVDEEIRKRFGALHDVLAAGVPDAWRADGHAMLGAIIVLDQFSRNLFRDDPRAYASDGVALALAREAIDRGLDRDLSADEKQFLYMPFMHSEVLADVERSEALMASIPNDDSADFARRHAAVIARFGRYPARNAALGRESTVEELAFLRDQPMGF